MKNRILLLGLALTGLALPQAIQNPPPGGTQPYMHWAGAWVATVPYNMQDVVTYNGGTYISIVQGNLNQTPAASSTYWTILPGTSTVTSVFGRVGDVATSTGDYTFPMIGGAAGCNQLPAAGGDVSGTLCAAHVAGIQNQPVSSLVPANGQLLMWNGSTWTPAALTCTQLPASGGDVTSASTACNAKVVALQGLPVSPLVPAVGMVLAWNGSAWAPSNTSAPVSPAYCSVASTGLPPLTGLTSNLPAAPVTCPTMTSLPAFTSSVTVNTSSDLTTALAGAVCGEQIVMTAGNTFSGNFTLPVVSCASNPISVVSSHLPSLAAGRRVQPSDVSNMATMVAATNTQVLTIPAATDGWYFAGLELTYPAGMTGAFQLIFGGTLATTVANLPKDITFDRVYVHGDGVSSNGRGFELDGNNIALINSYCSGWVAVGQDVQCWLSYNSSTGILLSNNYIEATGENVMFGTSPPPAGAGPPSDITITRNHFAKLVAWKTLPTGCTPGTNCYVTKNELECKWCQRMMVGGNVFGSMPCGAQCTWLIINCASTTQTCLDVTYQNNQFLHGPGNVLVFAGAGGSTIGRVWLNNNLAMDVDANTSGSPYSFSLSQSTDLTISHNTVIHTSQGPQMRCNWGGPTPADGCGAETRFNYVANISKGAIACDGNNAGGCSQEFITAGSTQKILTANVNDTFPKSCSTCGNSTPAYPTPLWWIGSVASTIHLYDTSFTNAGVSGACQYSDTAVASTCIPLAWGLVGFTSYTYPWSSSDNYVLLATSPLHAAYTDGTDYGANVPAVLAATSGVVQGSEPQ